MPKMPDDPMTGGHYQPRPLSAKPQKTPHDMTRIVPTSQKGLGKLGGLGDKVSGGGMQSGGKSRKGHNARYGID